MSSYSVLFSSYEEKMRQISLAADLAQASNGATVSLKKAWMLAVCLVEVKSNTQSYLIFVLNRGTTSVVV
jgi:hypothetical protein